MNFSEAIDFLYSRLPVFQQIGARAYKPGLETTRFLCDYLGNPERRFKSIHVGGTNGKGSSSHMLAAVLQQAGYKTGLYTSPHLKSFTERIRIDGKMISEQFVIDFVERITPVIETHSPSFFEITVVMAFDYFAAEQVDVAVIEVGMGGRMDSTNVITPVLSLITNISFDHMQYLGDTLPKIAREKAGIIKPGIPVVVSETASDEVMAVFGDVAATGGSALYIGDQLVTVSGAGVENGLNSFELKFSNSDRSFNITKIELDLGGMYQKKNLQGVLAALWAIRKAGFKLYEADICSGLRKSAKSTGLKGRWQQLQDAPVIIADTGHNPGGLAETIEQFCSLPHKKMRWVLGFVSDKDLGSVLGLFPANAVYYFCQPRNPRAMEVSKLADRATLFGLKGSCFNDVNSALQQAKNDASPEDIIYVGGSTFVVAEIDEL